VRAAVGCRARKVEEVEKVEKVEGKEPKPPPVKIRGEGRGTTRVPMCIVLVGRGFALRKWLATLLLASRPMWRGQLYMYPVKRSSTTSWQLRFTGYM
jgi:hypothetical protein